MSKERASIFEDPQELDVSEFKPRTGPDAKAPPAEQVRALAEAANFQSREVRSEKPAAPARVPRRYRTGRNVQFNIKASREAVDAFYAIADTQNWRLGETLERAILALKETLGSHKPFPPKRPDL